MSYIPDELIERIRDAADMVELIGEHVDLKRTGSDYRGPCPFHGGDNRNFSVIQRKQMFYCFVCHEAGDIFTFFIKKFGMDYPAAVREVGARVGIEVPERSSGGPDPREPLFEAVAVAQEWYARFLRENEEAAPARKYLARRGFPVEGSGELGFGFAPKGTAFPDAMKQLGIEDEVLLEAGLMVKREDGSLRPRFWNRMVIPIHDLRARVVGFGGRLLGDGEPKYLNSPDSRVFHKGLLLYNLHAARNPIRKNEHAILVEGYFDVLSLLHAGMDNVIAPLGTALTADQAKLLSRYTKHVTILYDSDKAGLRATFRAADEFLRNGFRVSVATLPEGQDPDTLARGGEDGDGGEGGAEAVKAVLEDAIDVLERKLQILERRGLMEDVAGRRKALDHLLATIRAPSDPVMRDLYVNRVAERIGISEDSIRREIRERHHRPAMQNTGTASPETRPRRGHRPGGGGEQTPERNLLRVMLHHPEWRQRVREHLTDFDLIGEPEKSLISLVMNTDPAIPDSDIVLGVEGEGRSLLEELLSEPRGDIDAEAIVSGTLDRIESRKLERSISDIHRRLPLADESEKPELTMQLDRLSREISKLNPGRWNVIRKGRTSAI